MKTVLSLFVGCLLLLAACGTPGYQSNEAAHREAPPSAEDATRAALLELDAYAAEQDGLLDEFQRTSVQAFKDRSAYLLSELWNAGLLRDEIKEQLVKEHYRVVLLQIYGNYGAPNFVVKGYQTFPFPEIWTEFTPTLYRNHRVEWSSDKPTTEHAMSANNCVITSRIGGVLNNGDILQYRIVMRQADRSPRESSGNMSADQVRPWEVSLWSNKLVVQGLEKSGSTIK